MNDKTKQALELALEALEDAKKNHGLVYVTELCAIREALAEQPAQNKEPCGWRKKYNGEWCYSFTEDAWDFIASVYGIKEKNT